MATKKPAAKKVSVKKAATKKPAAKKVSVKKAAANPGIPENQGKLLWSKEEIVEKQILPLYEKVGAICKEHKIPVLFWCLRSVYEKGCVSVLKAHPYVSLEEPYECLLARYQATRAAHMLCEPATPSEDLFNKLASLYNKLIKAKEAEDAKEDN